MSKEDIAMGARRQEVFLRDRSKIIFSSSANNGETVEYEVAARLGIHDSRNDVYIDKNATIVVKNMSPGWAAGREVLYNAFLQEHGVLVPKILDYSVDAFKDDVGDQVVVKEFVVGLDHPGRANLDSLNWQEVQIDLGQHVHRVRKLFDSRFPAWFRANRDRFGDMAPIFELGRLDLDMRPSNWVYTTQGWVLVDP